MQSLTKGNLKKNSNKNLEKNIQPTGHNPHVDKLNGESRRILIGGIRIRCLKS